MQGGRLRPAIDCADLDEEVLRRLLGNLHEDIKVHKKAKVVEEPPAKTIEAWKITVEGPGWLAGVSGHTGFHGVNPYAYLEVGQILKHLNAISTFAGEVRRDRFGVQGHRRTEGLVRSAGAGLDIPISASRWVYRPTWQSMGRALSLSTNSLNK
jgi:hypothetical protein